MSDRNDISEYGSPSMEGLSDAQLDALLAEPLPDALLDELEALLAPATDLEERTSAAVRSKALARDRTHLLGDLIALPWHALSALAHEGDDS